MVSDNRLKGMIAKVDGNDPHGIAIMPDELLSVFKELQAARVKIAAWEELAARNGWKPTFKTGPEDDN